MDWSSTFGNLINIRQNIANATTASDKKKYEKQEKELFSSIKSDDTLDFDDLVQLSNVSKDKNNDGTISDDEQSAYSSIKDLIYDTAAKNINKKSDLKANDIVDFEDKIRDLSEAQREEVGNELKKLQNRMVSNLTSQFFVTRESADYIENAASNIAEIWNAQEALDALNNSKNNPFSDTKADDLLDKIESRVTKTLSETYTAASIADAKDANDISKLIKKGSPEDISDESRFEKKDDGLLYHDDELYTGKYKELMYEQGAVLTGLSSVDFHFYKKGSPDSGKIEHENGTSIVGTYWVVDGEVKYEDKVKNIVDNYTVRTYYKEFKGSDAKSVIEKRVTFEGQVETGNDGSDCKLFIVEFFENGKKVSTDSYTNYKDGSYEIHTEYEDSRASENVRYMPNGKVFDGNGHFGDKFYVNDKLYTGYWAEEGRLYEKGQLAQGYRDAEGFKFFNGIKLTGICNQDGKYYDEGLIKPKAVDAEGKVYFYGDIANGVFAEDKANNAEGKDYNYYEAGEFIGTVSADIGQFITELELKCVHFEKDEDGKIIDTAFSAEQYIQYAWRAVQYKDVVIDEDGGLKSGVVTIPLDRGISQIDTYADSWLKSSAVKLQGMEPIDLNIDGSKKFDGVDYSIHFINADGLINSVQICDALNNSITRVREYVIDEEGNYSIDETKTKVVLGSIQDMQAGYKLRSYSPDEIRLILEDGNNITLSEFVNNSEDCVVIGAMTSSIILEPAEGETGTTITLNQTFGDDGTVASSEFKFSYTEGTAHTEKTINVSGYISHNFGEVKSGLDMIKVIDILSIQDKAGTNQKELVKGYYRIDNGERIGALEKVDLITSEEVLEKAEDLANVLGLSADKMYVLEADEDTNKVKKYLYNGTIYEVGYSAHESENEAYNGKPLITVKTEGMTKEILELVKKDKENNDVKVGVVISEEITTDAATTINKYTEEGVLTRYMFKVADNDYRECLYDGTTSKLKTVKVSTPLKNDEGELTGNVELSVVSYAADGSTIIDTKVTVVDSENNEISYTVYAGARSENKVSMIREREDGKLIETTFDITTGKKTEQKTIDGAEVYAVTFKADGTSVQTRTKTVYEDATREKALYAEKYDEYERKIELTTYNPEVEEGEPEISKIVEKYTYSATSDTINKVTRETYGANEVISKSEIIDKVNDDRLDSETFYTDGVKTLVVTYDDYYEDGSIKQITKEEYEGNSVKRIIIGTYDENGVYTETVGGSIIGQEDKEKDAITAEQRAFASAVGLTITDVKYNEDNSLAYIAGKRYGDNISYFTNLSVANNKYSYTEEIVLFGAETKETTADDFTFIAEVENGVQKYARLKVGNITYAVKIDNTTLQNNLGAALATYRFSDESPDSYVADIINTGVIRQRRFTKSEAEGVITYSLNTMLALGTLDEVEDSDKTKKVPKFNITETTSLDGETYTITPNSSNEIEVYLDGSTPAYKIQLQEGETFKISKDYAATSSYTQGTKTITTTYAFDDDGGYTKTEKKGDVEVVTAYDATGTMNYLSIGGNVIDLEHATFDNANKTVKVTKAKTGTTIGYTDLTFALEATDTRKVGDMIGGTIIFTDGTEYKLNDNGAEDKIVIAENGESIDISTKYTTDFSTAVTRGADGKFKSIKFNNTDLNLTDAETVTYNKTANEIVVSKAATVNKAGYAYTYTTVKTDSKNVGDMIRKVITTCDNPNGIEVKDGEELKMNTDFSYTITKTIADVAVVKSYSKTGTLTGLKVGGKDINMPNGAVFEFNETDKTVTVSKAATPKYSLVYDLKTGAIKSGSLFEGESSITNVVNATITFNDETSEVTIQAKDTTNATVYGYDGSLKELKLNKSSITLDEHTGVSQNTEDSTLTVTRSGSASKLNGTIVFNADGTVKSGTLTNSAISIELENGDIINEAATDGTIAIQRGNDFLIYTTACDEINCDLDLTKDQFEKLKTALNAYNKSSSKIVFDDITKAIVAGNVVTITTNSGVTTITINDDGTLKNYTENKANTSVPEVKELITYNSSGTATSKQLVIGKQVFSVPTSTTVTKSGEEITITYNSTTVKLSKVAVGEGENAQTPEFYNRIKIGSAEAEELAETATITIRNSGTVVKK